MDKKTQGINKRYLCIKKSGLPGAGKGLFTTTDISKGQLIIEYTGHITTWRKIRENEVFNGYVFYVNRSYVIDAMPYKKEPARYANDAKGPSKVTGLRNNAEYITRQKRVFIKATADIPAGAEILVDYGKEYWDTIKYNNRINAKKTKTGV
jgi:uncharacterized protein